MLLLKFIVQEGKVKCLKSVKKFQIQKTAELYYLWNVCPYYKNNSRKHGKKHKVG